MAKADTPFTTPFKKVGLIVGGYIACLLLAWAVTAVYVSLANADVRQASPGMSAFGDSVLFFAVFGLSSLVPTGAALYFLRGNPSFWRGLSVSCLAVAATGVVAVILFYVGRGHEKTTPAAMWASYSVLRILVSPLLALLFLVCSLFSSSDSAKKTLFRATVVEAGVFAAWFAPAIFHII